MMGFKKFCLFGFALVAPALLACETASAESVQFTTSGYFLDTVGNVNLGSAISDGAFTISFAGALETVPPLPTPLNTPTVAPLGTFNTAPFPAPPETSAPLSDIDFVLQITQTVPSPTGGNPGQVTATLTGQLSSQTNGNSSDVLVDFGTNSASITSSDGVMKYAPLSEFLNPNTTTGINGAVTFLGNSLTTPLPKSLWGGLVLMGCCGISLKTRRAADNVI